MDLLTYSLLKINCMKNIISLLTAFAFVCSIASCSKKDNPQPSTQNSNSNNTTNTPTFAAKPVTTYFYYGYNTPAVLTCNFGKKDSIKFIGTVSQKRQKTSMCIEPDHYEYTTISAAGRYYYEFYNGANKNALVKTHAGYIDVASDGSVTNTVTMQTGTNQSVTVSYCGDRYSLTVYYADKLSTYND